VKSSPFLSKPYASASPAIPASMIIICPTRCEDMFGKTLPKWRKSGIRSRNTESDESSKACVQGRQAARGKGPGPNRAQEGGMLTEDSAEVLHLKLVGGSTTRCWKSAARHYMLVSP
jgi:hypothetical protein